MRRGLPLTFCLTPCGLIAAGDDALLPGLPGLLGGLVDQTVHGVMGEHQPVDLLDDGIWRLAAQRGAELLSAFNRTRTVLPGTGLYIVGELP